MSKRKCILRPNEECLQRLFANPPPPPEGADYDEHEHLFFAWKHSFYYKPPECRKMPPSMVLEQLRTSSQREQFQSEATISLDSEELYFHAWVLNLEARPSIGRKEISALFNYHVQVLEADSGGCADNLELIEEARDALVAALAAADNDRQLTGNTSEEPPWRQRRCQQP